MDLSSLLVPAAFSVGGALLGNVVAGDTPEVPDLTAPTVNRTREARADTVRSLDRQADNLTEELAAAGVTGAAGGAAKQQQQLGSADALANLDAAAADAIAEAEQAELLEAYRQRVQRQQATAGGIASALSNIGQFLTVQSILGD